MPSRTNSTFATVQPVRERIRRGFHDLSPGLQQAARYALEHANEVVMLSMRSLSSQAQLPAVTLVRLAQALGYTGWPQVKAAFAQDLGLTREPASYSARAKQLMVRGQRDAADESSLLSELVQAQRDNLSASVDRNAPMLKSAAQQLIAAQAVHVAGFRASYPMAYELAYVYRLFRNSVHLLDGHAGGLEMQLRQLQAKDTVVVIGFEPCSKESVQVAQAARQAKCHLIALTDSEASPLASLAHQSLFFSVHSPSFFPSITAGMALVEALMEHVLAQSEPQVIARIRAAEQQLNATGAYLKNPSHTSLHPVKNIPR